MRRRSAPLAAIALAIALAVTGCGPVNAASGAVDLFTKHMEGQPGVAAVDGGGSNNLPFMGSATVTVTMEDDAEEATVAAVVERMADYVRDYPYQVTWSMWLELDGYRLDIETDAQANDAVLAMLHDVRGVDGVIGGELGEDCDAILANGTDAVEALTTLLALDSTVGVTVRTADGSAEIGSSVTGEPPTDEIAVMQAVSAQFPILSVRIYRGLVELRLQRDADIAAATELARATPGSSSIDLVISGGIVTRSGDGSFDVVDPIIEQALAVPDVAAIDASADIVGFTVTSLDAVTALEAIVASAGADGLSVYYRSALDTVPGFALYGSAERRAAFLPVVAALLADDYVTRVEVLADRVDVTAGAYDEQRMTLLNSQLDALVTDGSSIRVTNE